MDTIRVNKENANLGYSIWEIIEDNETLGAKDRLLLDIIQFGEIGFERKSDWVRFCNKLDSCNITPLRRRFIGDKEEGFYYAKIKFDYSKVTISFDEPIFVVFGEVGDEYIVSKVKEIKGLISWEWFYSNNNELEIANICEVFLTDIKFLK